MRRTLMIALVLGWIAAPARPEEKAEELKLTVNEQAVLDATNAERKKADLPPLTANAKLFAAARGHALNMARQQKLEHTLDDKTAGQRVTDSGYKFSRTGENIAWNQETAKEVLQSWMNSEGHKANILTKEYTEIGVAVAKNEKGERYWVQVFGAPR